MGYEYALFPFGQVKKDDNIIIYGAGLVGKNFLAQVKKENYCKVLFMADKKYDQIKRSYIDVRSPEEISNCENYDYVVIAVLDDKVKQEISDELQNNYHIPAEKIIQPSNNVINWQFGFSDIESANTFAQKYPDYLELIAPKKLVSPKRIDIVTRYLLFKDLVNGYENQETLSLFTRYQMTRTNGYEGPMLHSSKIKQDIWAYIEEAKSLCESMKKEGFQKEHFVPVNEKYESLDGMHRISAAIALDEKIYAHKYRGLQQPHVDFSWFENEAFTMEDRIRILRGFTDIYEGQMGILVLFEPASNLWDYIEQQTSKYYTIVGKVDYDFEHNFVAFENIIHEFYSDSRYKGDLIQRKIDVLKYERLRLRVVVVCALEGIQEDFYSSLRNFKLDMRQRLWYDLSEVPVVMHTSDTANEFEHLKMILLSVNNLRNMERKSCSMYRNKFFDMLNELGMWCQANKVDTKDVLIAGSAVMEVFGIRECSDVDFLIHSKYRDKMDVKRIKISERLELTTSDINDIKGNSFTADTVLSDDNLYFYFAGWKFLNLEFVYAKKKHAQRDKDVKDVRLMDLFYNWDAVFDNKAVLRNRIHDEMIRRKF